MSLLFSSLVFSWFVVGCLSFGVSCLCCVWFGVVWFVLFVVGCWLLFVGCVVCVACCVGVLVLVVCCWLLSVVVARVCCLFDACGLA